VLRPVRALPFLITSAEILTPVSQLTDIIGNTLDGRYPNLWYFVILIDVSQVDISKLCSIRPRGQLGLRPNKKDEPEMYTQAVDMCSSQEITRWRKCYAGSDRAGTESIDQTTGGDIECTYCRI